MNLYDLVSGLVLLDYISLPTMELIRRVNTQFRTFFEENRSLLSYLQAKYYPCRGISFQTMLHIVDMKDVLRGACENNFVEIVRVIIASCLSCSRNILDLLIIAAEHQSYQVFSLLMMNLHAGEYEATNVPRYGHFIFTVMKSCNAQIYREFFRCRFDYSKYDVYDDPSHAYIHWKLTGDREPYDIICESMNVEGEDIIALRHTDNVNFAKYLLENGYTKSELLEEVLHHSDCGQYLLGLE